jgi:hypothetical protein
MALGDGDRDAFLADFGEDLQIGSTVARGIVDDSEEPILDAVAGNFIGPAMRIRVWTTDWTGVLAEGVLLTRIAAAKSYRVMRHERVDDGKWTMIFCALT